MTKYIAEILRQLGIDYEEYRTENHWDEESGETWTPGLARPRSCLLPKSILALRKTR